MSAISLEKSVRTCDVNVDEANRIQSDRFFNPAVMVCPVWNGINSKGQAVCPDSFYTKNPGCDSAEDRVLVENAQRPKYVNYVTLGAEGIAGHVYGNEMAYATSISRDKFVDSRDNITGNFGTQFGATNRCTDCSKNTSCSVDAYERAMAQTAQNERKAAYSNNAYMGHSYQMAGGAY